MRRRQAVDKINSLPEASEQQLREFDDVCAICYQELLTARITRCNHYFHGVCLRKWLYVQDICPLCHEILCAETEPPVTDNSNEHIHPEDVMFHVNPIPDQDNTSSESDDDSSESSSSSTSPTARTLHVIQEATNDEPPESSDLLLNSGCSGSQVNGLQSIIQEPE
jgi:E3 ubiquitin-protein ligase RNF139